MSPIIAGILLSMFLALGACVDSNLISSSSSFSPIQVTVLSSNGTDLTSSIPVLHSNALISTLQKRSATSTTIRDCPSSGVNISRSWCLHSYSPQKFETFCREPDLGRTDPHSYMYYTVGACADDEICVGSEAGDSHTPTQAYCVSTTHFVPIGHNNQTELDPKLASAAGVVTANFNAALHSPGNGSYLAVEAVVTTANKTTSLSATSVVMQAQALHGPVWRTEAHGYNYCMDCSTLRVAPFPVTATRIKVDVVMPELMPTGLLWLASYLYE